VFGSISAKDHPIGIIAAARQSRASLEDFSRGDFTLGVALVAPQDPGNVGTILRTIDAVGADGLLLLDGGADAYHPSAVRACMGALFTKPMVAASFAECVSWARRQGVRLTGSSADAETDYRAASYGRPLLIVMGSEQKGLSGEQVAACDETVRLPMRGTVSSLNLAVATGVLLYEAIRREEG
jgi:TrmH family RNA methyltransferase